MTFLKSIVTGGAGFIGSHLVDLLLGLGHEVHVIDNFSGGHRSNLEHNSQNPRLKIHACDITEIGRHLEVFENALYVFHLAGIGDIVPSIEKPLDYFNTNVQGTVNVLEASRLSGVQRFVYAASSSCYGLANYPTDESAQIQPLYPYAMSKFMGELAAFHWQRVYGLEVNSVCIFNAYGPRVRTTGAYGAVFGVFLKQKLSEKPFTIVGDGSQKRDFIYVTDVAKAFWLSAISPNYGERFNIGAGNPRSVNELVEILGGESIHLPKRPGEPDITFADISKARKILKWEPEIDFLTGVNMMMEKISDWENAPLWEPHNIAIATKNWFRYMSNSLK